GGGGIAIHTNVNEALHVFTSEEGIVLDIKNQINKSQSTADVLSTASGISLYRLGIQALHVLQATEKMLLEKAQEFEGIQTMARTCLRDAMPAPLSKLFEGYAQVTARHAQSLSDAIQSLREVNLGGTVIGSGEGASSIYQEKVISFLNEVTGLSLNRKDNLYDAAQNIDRLGRVSSVLADLAASWIKISKDLRLMGSGPAAGFDEITLPEAIPGSSFFSGKVNPTLPETVLQACFLVLGNHRCVQAAEEHGELYLNVFETLAVIKTYESLEALSVALDKLNQHCLKNLKANSQSCQNWVRQWEEKQNG
ncbi:MAG: aspartate ammonia-lyase, partial [Proteobacteria bacterium]|nr:aspartate ammonia-lyase [Pseudomonadota bacterium]NDG28444.1 aspartate ammonia-lyase [Pseudomonadota bacterium]